MNSILSQQKDIYPQTNERIIIHFMNHEFFFHDHQPGI